MYVPNMIGIPTNGVDLWHHGLRIGERNHKSPMEPPQVEERRKKKERRKKEKGVGASWQASHVMSEGATHAA
jgi:hypothetical protein